MKKVLVLPGDGIGKEVVAPAVEVLQVAAQQQGVAIELEEALVGGAAIDDCGSPLPEVTWQKPKPPTRCCWVGWVVLSGMNCPRLNVRRRVCWAFDKNWVCLPICDRRY